MYRVSRVRWRIIADKGRTAVSPRGKSILSTLVSGPLPLRLDSPRLVTRTRAQMEIYEHSRAIRIRSVWFSFVTNFVSNRVPVTLIYRRGVAQRTARCEKYTLAIAVDAIAAQERRQPSRNSSSVRVLRAKLVVRV